MPIIRNPFRKSPTDIYTEETLPPLASGTNGSDGKFNAFTSSKPLTIRSNDSQRQPMEYQLSEINDSGVFIPPSPPDTKSSSLWSSRSAASTRSSSHRSVFNENEPFNISRESFDSYRRSFDISARSPILEASNSYGRQSLDARQRNLRLPQASSSPPLPKMSPTNGPVQEEDLHEQDGMHRRPGASPYQPKYLAALTDDHVNPPASEPDESEDAQPIGNGEISDSRQIGHSAVDRFEDVGLGDDPLTRKRLQQQQQQYHPGAKKQSLFARFTSSSSSEPNASTAEGAARPGSSGLGMGLFGRKRGHSGQGAELGNIHGKTQIGSSGAEASVDSS